MNLHRKTEVLHAFAAVVATLPSMATAAPLDSVQVSSGSFLTRTSTEIRIDLNTGAMISKSTHTLYYEKDGMDIIEKHRTISPVDLISLQNSAKRAIDAGFRSAECRKQDAIERKLKYPPTIEPPMLDGFAMISLHYGDRSDQANFDNCASPEMNALSATVASARAHATDPAKR
jgi:hypothetical protein